jgi:hypothetical protein
MHFPTRRAMLRLHLRDAMGSAAANCRTPNSLEIDLQSEGAEHAFILRGVVIDQQRPCAVDRFTGEGLKRGDVDPVENFLDVSVDPPSRA